MTGTYIRGKFIIAVAILGGICGLLPAQTVQAPGIAFQQASVLGVPGGAVVVSGPTTMAAPVLGVGLFGPEAVTGSPFSATRQSHSLQVLGDGTRIERSETQQVYRDSMGRTRVESGQSGSGTVTIQDPVAGSMIVVDTAAKTAQEMPAPHLLTKLRTPAGVSSVSNEQTALIAPRVQKFSVSGPSISASTGADGLVTVRALAPPQTTGNALEPVIEDLPSQDVNGTLAAGRKTTLTIPLGEIGNDRPILVVRETWYSNDLQMVVKSSNSDPRFGDTSYELTNIVRSEPDPSLFQIPAGYTVSENAPVQLKVVAPK